MKQELHDVQVIAFDADDTMWVNEPYFQETEHKFCALLEDYAPHHTISQELYKTEMNNLALYGYGIKSFVLSMIETASNLTQGTVSLALVDRIIRLGKEMLQKPVELLEGVEEVLQSLHGRFRLVMATKGDLLDQERKLILSGLEHYFHHIEIMSDKKVADYQKLIRHLDCAPPQFIMVGNSIRSDVLPVLEVGAHAIHIPYHTTWVHEEVDHQIDSPRFYEFKKISELMDIFKE
jgi:putative hydrolase of the HAD superfamily